MEFEDMAGCGVTRRDALKVMIAGGMVMVGLLATDAEAGAAAKWVKAGAVKNFEIGVPKKVTLPDKQVVFIVQKDKKTWSAISAVCTHKGKEVNWDAAQKRYVCPAHGATFDMAGQDPHMPAKAPLATAAAKVKGKEVMVDTEKLTAAPGEKKPAEGGESKPEAPK